MKFLNNVEIDGLLTVGGTNILTELNSIKQSFQDGCDTIVAGCTTYGSTPASNSPSDIVVSIKNIYDNRYSQGKNNASSSIASKSFTLELSYGSYL